MDEEDDEWDEDEGSEDGDEEELSPADLKKKWDQESRAVKALEWQGIPESSAVLAAARAARDQAEKEWRQARITPPVAIRMGRAQRKLAAAEKALTKRRYELDEFDEKVDAQRQEILLKIADAEDRYQMRWNQLDDLQVEAGEQAAGSGGTDGTKPNAQKDERLRDMVASELHALVETLQEGTEAREKANLLLAKIASPEQPRHYRLDQDEQGDARTDGGNGCGKGGASAAPRGPHSKARGAAAAWSTDAHGRWNKAQGAKGRGTSTDLNGDQRSIADPVCNANQLDAATGTSGPASPPTMTTTTTTACLPPPPRFLPTTRRCVRPTPQTQREATT